ncbi:MAG: hypothetical protein CMP55_02165 [Flavobacteriales bacterium]|nr:hypothetical protein [Flavobacteriales bacterium]
MNILSVFFEKIKQISLIQRIFYWGSIRSISYEAYDQFKNIEAQQANLQIELDNLKNKIALIQSEKDGLSEKNQSFEKLIITKDSDIRNLSSKIDSLNEKINNLNNEVSRYETTEDSRKLSYENKITELNQIKKNLDDDRTRLSDERLEEKQKEFDNMKKQWSEHEIAVENKIKQLCQTHLIKYVEKVPFKGSPDNTIEICDEFIIFDAKSPANKDLNNFPKYIKDQTDGLKKYADKPNVRKEIFLVVPSNTIEIIPQLTFNMASYNVYIITLDSLEPIILSLKKIEEYEFAEQLSPEQRDNICRVIGRFAHTTKRKIQIDQFFANEFIELLVKCKNDLPEELLKSVIEFEKAEKLNPPIEKRSKQILTKDLKQKNDSINAEAQVRKIHIPSSFEEMKKLQ